MARNIIIRSIPAALLGLTLCLPVAPARAHHLLEQHALACDTTFPCPPELARRIDFWIEVFHTYGAGHIVFHDAKRPERVYSVLEGKGLTCSERGAATPAQRERKRLEAMLTDIAGKIATDNPGWSEEQMHLAYLFPDRNSGEIREAVGSIRCQEGVRDRFVSGLQRYGAYRDTVVTALREAKLAEDIQYLPFVESAYDPKAYSRVGAAGLWQIMPRTARTLGLELSAAIDERFDPETATLGAIRYLRESHGSLHALARSLDPNVAPGAVNPFVITSYNYGVGGMLSAMRRMGPNFVKVLHEYKAPTFRVAVQNFYASFLAARHVAKNSATYFKSIQYDPPRSYDLAALNEAISTKRLAEHLEVPEERLRELNPGLTKRVWEGQGLVPKGYTLRLPKRDEGWNTKLVALRREAPEKPPVVAGDSYRVQSGDTACGVARSFGVACKAFVEANGLDAKARLQIGQIVTIPGKGATPAATPVLVASAAPTPLALARPAVPELHVAARVVSTPAPEPVALHAAATAPAVSAAPPPAIELHAAAAVRPAPSGGADAGAKAVEPVQLAEAFGVGADLFVTEKRIGSEIVYVIRVEAEETLGHYADWLGIGTSESLRRLNNIKSDKTLRIGQELRLPLLGAETKKEFERGRIAYHRALEDEFREHYRIVGQEYHRVKSGDSGWTLAAELEVPLWLLKRFNPDILTKAPAIGATITIPTIQARESRKGA